MFGAKSIFVDLGLFGSGVKTSVADARSMTFRRSAMLRMKRNTQGVANLIDLCSSDFRVKGKGEKPSRKFLRKRWRLIVARIGGERGDERVMDR